MNRASIIRADVSVRDGILCRRGTMWFGSVWYCTVRAGTDVFYLWYVSVRNGIRCRCVLYGSLLYGIADTGRDGLYCTFKYVMGYGVSAVLRGFVLYGIALYGPGRFVSVRNGIRCRCGTVPVWYCTVRAGTACSILARSSS